MSCWFVELSGHRLEQLLLHKVRRRNFLDPGCGDGRERLHKVSSWDLLNHARGQLFKHVLGLPQPELGACDNLLSGGVKPIHMADVLPGPLLHVCSTALRAALRSEGGAHDGLL